MIRLLDDSLQEVGRLNPISLGVNENAVPLDTATMTLLREQAIPIRSWVEITNPNGSVGIYRTHSPSMAYGSGNDTYELEHAVCEIGDYIIKEEIEETPMTLPNAIARVFSHYGGSKWQIGTVCNGDVVVSEQYQNLLQYMNTVIAQVDGAYMTFDFSTTPWTLNVQKMDTEVSAEGRLSRNVNSVVIRRDDSNLCTRVSMDSLGADVVDADTINTWGVIEHRLTGEFIKSEAILYAQRYLAKYKNPLYTVTINGYDFYQITGEPFDQVKIGKLYRLAIPDDGVIIECPVIAISWQDIIKTPNVVNITLGEPETTMTGNIFLRETEQRRKNDHYESTIKFTSKELESLYTKTGVNDLGEDETLYSKIEQTADGILLEVANDYYAKQTKVDITPNGIDIKTGGSMSIEAGGTLDVNTNNFKLNSAQKQMVAGDWELNENGLSKKASNNKYVHLGAGSGEFEFSLDESSPGAPGNSLAVFFVQGVGTYSPGIGNEGTIVFTSGSGSQGFVGQQNRPVKEVWADYLCYTTLSPQSSRKVKHDINNMDDMGEIIDALNPVTYRYNSDPDKLRYGLIYEDTLSVMPDICITGKDCAGINYSDLIPVLLKEVQSLRKRIKELENR